MYTLHSNVTFLCFLLLYLSDLSKAQRAFSETLINFNFECIGTSQTDAEIDICKYANN